MEVAIEMNDNRPYSLEIDTASHIDIGRLAEAVTVTFDLPPDTVATKIPARSKPGVRIGSSIDGQVRIQQVEGFAGDFPHEFHIVFELGKPKNLVAVLGTLALQLGDAFITNNDVTANSDAAVYLALPDGTVFDTLLDADAIDEARLVLRPDDRLRMKQALAWSANMAMTG